MLLKGKVVLVTGGASGIELASVEEFLKNDVSGVVLVDINEHSGIAAAHNFNSKYGEGKVIFVKADIREKDEFEGAFMKTIETFNQLDIVINNAGVCDEQNYETCWDINMKGAVHGLKLAIDKYLPKYKNGKDALIINTASTLGLTPSIAFEIYSSTKFGIIGLTRNFGCDYHYERTGVKVIAICPSATDTPIVEQTLKTLIYKDAESVRKQFAAMKPQTAEQVAKCLIRIIEKEENGSTWVIQAGKESMVTFPKLLKM